MEHLEAEELECHRQRGPVIIIVELIRVDLRFRKSRDCKVRAIEAELEKFDPELSQRPRWLVFNKADLLDTKEREKRAKAIVRKLKWKAPWFVVSAIAKDGTWPVCLKVQDFFEQLKAEAVEEMRSLDA